MNKSFFKSNYFTIIIFIILCLMFTSPIFANNNVGIFDWDLHLSLSLITEKSIKEHQQIPLWTPYVCGGQPLHEHPLSMWLYPLFFANLLFGPLIGFKIQIFLHLFIAMLGMYFLSKYIKISWPHNLLPSIILAFSSIFVSFATGGFTEWFSGMLLPWIFLFYLKSFKNKKYWFLTSLFITFIFFSGGIYNLAFIVIFLIIYSIFRSFKERKIFPITGLIVIIIFVILIGAIKFTPAIPYVYSHPRVTTTDWYTSYGLLYNSLLNRDQTIFADKEQTVFTHYAVPPPGQNEQGIFWWEQSAYVGIIPVALFIIGIFLCWRKRWPLIVTAIIFLDIILDNVAPIPIYPALHALPLMEFLRVPQRFLIIFVFILALISGLSLQKICHRFSYKKALIPTIIILLITIDLMLVSRPVFEDAFTITPNNISMSKDFYQTQALLLNPKIAPRNSNFLEYYMNNKGLINCFDGLPYSVSTIPHNSVKYKGEYYLEQESGSINLVYFSSNKVTVNIDTNQEDKAIINQNYYDGWRIYGSVDNKASAHNGLISTSVNKNTNNVTFYYLPNKFLKGSLVSVIIFLIIIFISRRKWPN